MWLNHGDSNTQFFFHAMKERIMHNSIEVLYNVVGDKLTFTPDIEAEVLNFYHSLLALWVIDDDKAPGIDGFNNHFFKKAWHVVRHDVCVVVLQFFDSSVLLPEINCTLVTLIPKSMIRSVVDLAQAGFMPGRNISNNILVATELIKSYNTKHVSPRCMLKVDFKKAYDSIEWSFLKTVMCEIGFPSQFVKWTMACVTSVSFSILINGIPCKPFPAKKDSASFQHVFDAFSKFSQASGLEANLDKSHLYIGGVEMNQRDILQSVVHIPLGSFPFKYLGVPLTTRKLFYNECKPLIEKTMTSVRVWFVEKLSYAARL
ncbi:uncharacterized protein LOC130589860 [Beta vulgaris subsp. vulgaris]|uniref:uncharacterized protein LOC130589860 n=1 Tax=Beta vulgaris subsp. vulgaris TaxID=3555 RepID=UPI002547CCC0|nr:uncharacterized protein LOC130589860 [Beta vulgaris subsp. vulgaris]